MNLIIRRYPKLQLKTFVPETLHYNCNVIAGKLLKSQGG